MKTLEKLDRRIVEVVCRYTTFILIGCVACILGALASKHLLSTDEVDNKVLASYEMNEAACDGIDRMIGSKKWYTHYSDGKCRVCSGYDTTFPCIDYIDFDVSSK